MYSAELQKSWRMGQVLRVTRFGNNATKSAENSGVVTKDPLTSLTEIKGLFTSWQSQRESNPCLRRERAIS
jgi:glutamate 5-kinase